MSYSDDYFRQLAAQFISSNVSLSKFFDDQGSTLEILNKWRKQSETRSETNDLYSPFKHNRWDLSNNEAERMPKRDVVISGLSVIFLAFLVGKVIMVFYSRSRDSTDRNTSGTVNEATIRTRPVNQYYHQTRNDTYQRNYRNSFLPNGTGDVQAYGQNLNRSTAVSHLGDQRYARRWDRENVSLQVHGRPLSHLRSDTRCDSEVSIDQSYGSSSPSVHLHLEDDVILENQQSNRSLSYLDLPPSYDMITKYCILDSASSVEHCGSVPAVMEMVAPPTYADAVDSFAVLSTDSDEIESLV